MAEISGYNNRLEARRQRTLEHSLQSLFPGAGQVGEATFWSGLRPMTPDGTPIVGATPIANLFTNTGHGTLGWTHAAGSGKVLAMLIDGDQPPIDFPFDRAAQGAWPGSGLAGRGAMEAAR